MAGVARNATDICAATGSALASDRQSAPAAAAWCVYMLACRNGSLYTGISNDVLARYAAHCSGKGARYTRAHPPQQLLAVLHCANRSEASKLEAQIKKLKRPAKLAWCAQNAWTPVA
ncbi:GIY-YIG nuclease superfamily protein [Amantichitinum ursilacus]|uniref:GIY-YIG nuclease superfamily protein n=2 Tax=Amantichitinum ursilacus TaxID=857265 RepID=A0A0N0GMV3_9NEIS|nr:GIY-YIG nuclease superfamily protein [Amantichitinum ursilacus]